MDSQQIQAAVRDSDSAASILALARAVRDLNKRLVGLELPKEEEGASSQPVPKLVNPKE